MGGSAPKGTGSSGGDGSQKKDPSKATGIGAKFQKRYGGEANHKGVGNGSKGHTPKLVHGSRKTIVEKGDIAEGQHSIKAFLNSDGTVNPEREKLHDRIVFQHFEGVSKPEGQPVFMMMGGGPNAGKSSVIKSGQVSVPDKFNSIHLNPDDIKEEIPEYLKRAAAGDETAAEYAHEESSAIAKRVQAVAFENGYSTVLDGTGDGSIESVRKKIRAAREAGMRVEGCYVTCGLEEALTRNRERAKTDKNGRLVPTKIVRNTHINVSQIFPEVAGEFDTISFYDTSGVPIGSPPILIATGGGGKPLKIIDKKRYEAFISKGKLPLSVD